MTEPPRYEIRTVHDFAIVPPDRRGVCLDEFQHWLVMCDGLIELANGMFQMPEAYIWIDDGKHEATVSLSSGDEQVFIARGTIKGFDGE